MIPHRTAIRHNIINDLEDEFSDGSVVVFKSPDLPLSDPTSELPAINIDSGQEDSRDGPLMGGEERDYTVRLILTVLHRESEDINDVRDQIISRIEKAMYNDLRKNNTTTDTRYTDMTAPTDFDAEVDGFGVVPIQVVGITYICPYRPNPGYPYIDQ